LLTNNRGPKEEAEKDRGRINPQERLRFCHERKGGVARSHPSEIVLSLIDQK